jgi:hypothetical protein
MIIPIPDENKYLKGYLYYPGNGLELFLPPHEIVHFKGFNPFSRFVGLSAAIESLMVIAQGYIGMTEWQTKLYKKNNARLPGIMSFEQMIADPTWQKIKEDTREAANNRELLMLRGVGVNGAKWQQSASSQKEMEFGQTLDALDKKIMDTLAPGAYTMLYENANEANSRTGSATLDKHIYSLLVMMDQKITNDILSVYPGRPLIGSFEDPRAADKQMELQEQDRFERTHTLDEIRSEKYGDAPIGDERGKLLPVQINTQSGGIQKPPPAPESKTLQELRSTQNAPPNEPTENDKAAQEMADALAKYERYALRKKGQTMTFSNDVLPAKLIQEIAAKLSGVQSEADIRAVFKQYKEKRNGHGADGLQILKGIELGVRALEVANAR